MYNTLPKIQFIVKGLVRIKISTFRNLMFPHSVVSRMKLRSGKNGHAVALSDQNASDVLLTGNGDLASDALVSSQIPETFHSMLSDFCQSLLIFS